MICEICEGVEIGVRNLAAHLVVVHSDLGFFPLYALNNEREYMCCCGLYTNDLVKHLSERGGLLVHIAEVQMTGDTDRQPFMRALSARTCMTTQHPTTFIKRNNP